VWAYVGCEAAGTPSLFRLKPQANPCRCSRRVASIIERIDLGCASNLMRVLIGLTAPKVGFQLAKPPLALELAFTGCGVYASQPKSNHRVF